MGKLATLGLIIAAAPVTLTVHVLHLTLQLAERVEQIKESL